MIYKKKTSLGIEMRGTLALSLWYFAAPRLAIAAEDGGRYMCISNKNRTSSGFKVRTEKIAGLTNQKLTADSKVWKNTGAVVGIALILLTAS